VRDEENNSLKIFGCLAHNNIKNSVCCPKTDYFLGANDQNSATKTALDNKCANSKSRSFWEKCKL
jgi:hypothetical protein